MSKMLWVGEYRHYQRLDQGEPMLSLWLVSVAGSQEGTVQLAQEQDDGLFVHHGGLSVHGHHPTPGPDVGGDGLLLGDAVGGQVTSGIGGNTLPYGQGEDEPWSSPRG